MARVHRMTPTHDLVKIEDRQRHRQTHGHMDVDMDVNVVVMCAGVRYAAEHVG